MQVLLDPQCCGSAHCAKADANDSEALRWAAESGNLDMVKLLLDPEATGEAHRAHADACESEAMRVAAEAGNLEMVKVCAMGCGAGCGVWGAAVELVLSDAAQNGIGQRNA